MLYRERERERESASVKKRRRDLGRSKMLPLQRNGELDHRIPYMIPCQPEKSQHDLISIPPVTTTGKRTLPPPDLRLSENNNNIGTNNGTSSENKVKRIMHRDIERQRRQEMTKLYSSLRSLLPLEYIKGKRAIADHMHEAVNYIKHLQNNIGELRSRRDKLLINKPNSSTGSSDDSNSAAVSVFSSSTTVTVNPCRDGVEILIGSSLNEEVLPLSRVLKKLLEEGINAVSCISTKSSETVIHRIITQVTGDPKCIDVRALQEKLTNAIICRCHSD